MPYIIAVLALVVVGVGFTLYQSSDKPVDQLATTETELITEVEPAALEEPAPEISTSEYEVAYREEDDEDKDEEEDDDEKPYSQPVTQPAVAETAPITPTPVVTPTPAVPAAPANDFKDGVYTSHITYRTPEGTYAMDVTLTIANDKVVTSDISYDSKTARDSYTKRFDSSYESYVTGKNLDGVTLSRVGGASLTTTAFNKAVADIKTKASA